ncbi:dTDP-glucose 4,6-dehydratase [Gottschalkiaceae bacterium SANA]|nr:dTDP-glucose 4,6-dehydratase [Gottschalkiaceae bacterium SANA]
MKTILVAGGAGFIGSNFIRMMVNTYSDYLVINVDALTYAGNLDNLRDVEKNEHYRFIKADIRDREKIEAIFDAYDIDWVVNFAAESHVDRSIEEPTVFLTTNILGTQTLLDVAKDHWKVSSENKCQPYKEGVKYLQVSTDEVYGALGEKGKFIEIMPLLPNNPYSASKASADLIVRAYHKTFGMPVNITRCSNNYGPYQFPEKLIPFMIQQCIKEEAMPLYGDGMQVRDWLHVWDHCSALDLVLHQGKVGEIYNIGGNNEKTNIEICKLIIEGLGKSEELIHFVEDRPGHDRRYAIDNSKIASQLAWQPSYSFEQGMKETIQWYVDHAEWMRRLVSGDDET